MTLLSAALKRNTVATELELEGNGCGSAGARALGDALCSNTALSALGLGSTELCGIDTNSRGKFDAAGITAVAKVRRGRAPCSTL